MSITAEGAGFPNRFQENQFNILGSSSGMLPDPTLVQVTELTSDVVNPTPRHLSSSDGFLEEYIGEQKLKDLTGKDDLSAVTFLEIKFDINVVSCGNFGSLLPNLRELRLIKSNIPALRDLGSSLNALEILWMPRSCLKCLDGLSGMSNLVELYLAFNELKDISACAMLELLEVLDLEGNHISEKTNLSYLKLCSNLTNLTLEGNPIVSEMGGIKRYRKTVRKMLPQLRKLDDIPIESNAAPKSSEYDINKFDNEWNYINTLLKEVGLISESSVVKKETHANTPLNAAEDKSSPNALLEEEPMKPGRAGCGLRPASGKRRLSTANEYRKASPNLVLSRAGQRPATASSYMTNEALESEETTSGLTTGRIVCGGIGGALRSRRGSGNKSKFLPATIDTVSSSSSTTLFPRPDTNKTDTTVPDDAVQYTHRNMPDTLTVSKKTVSNSGEKQPERSSQKDKTVRKTGRKKQSIDPSSVDVILQEEEQLRAECDAVLKELADWRKMYSESQVFRARKAAPQILKVHPAQKDTDAILFSTDSESTAEERSGASTRNNRSQLLGSSTPGSHEANLDEEWSNDVPNCSAYESQHTNTAVTDSVKSPYELNVKDKSKIGLGPATNTVNQNLESDGRHTISGSSEPKQHQTTENVLGRQSSNISSSHEPKLVQTLGDVAKGNTDRKSSSSSETKPKPKLSTDNLLPGQSLSLHTHKSGPNRLSPASFPPVMSNSSRAAAHSLSNGSTKAHAQPGTTYRPRLTSSFQPNPNSTQLQTAGGDVVHRTRNSSHATRNTSNLPGSKGLTNRLETTGRLTLKLTGPMPSPLPSKPTAQPKL